MPGHEQLSDAYFDIRDISAHDHVLAVYNHGRPWPSGEQTALLSMRCLCGDQRLSLASTRDTAIGVQAHPRRVGTPASLRNPAMARNVSWPAALASASA
jgi:hypothetical protein